ncbi:hypothetical protein [Paenibacillus glycanilyticus]|uniref:Uncharacterized protein n=1 Tax=Paenibacillus glycanilyticus TaxID=126569 RepID=A0ABQ6GD44_9BACL|nr:hypothetical protein [Paenibacillus glycanilyticus]GLX68020.1 hypothetical protein MU1_23650 [Paenibacillus glycanilyticus]
MNKQTLLEWENNHDAINTTIDGFWKCFRQWRTEEKDEYHSTFQGKLYEDFIRVLYLKYTFGVEEAVIFCSVHILYLEELIGTYDIEFSLDGDIGDDYLDFNAVLLREKMMKIQHNLRVARSAIREGIEIGKISTITGILPGALQIIKEKYY